MTIIQPDDFKGELNLPYQSDNVSADIIQVFIDKYEPKFLRMLLGAGLYQQLVNGLDVDEDTAVEQKWLDLQDMVKPALLNYIYYWVRRDGVSFTTNVGEVISGSANSTTVSPNQKMVRAWNEMVDMNYGIVNAWNIAIYTPYYHPYVYQNQFWGTYNHIVPEIFRKINVSNI